MKKETLTDKFGTELSIGDKVAFINGKTDWRQTPRFIKGTITGYNPTKNWFQVEEDLTKAVFNKEPGSLIRTL